MDGSTMSTAHKTARAGPFLRGFTNSPWTWLRSTAWIAGIVRDSLGPSVSGDRKPFPGARGRRGQRLGSHATETGLHARISRGTGTRWSARNCRPYCGVALLLVRSHMEDAMCYVREYKIFEDRKKAEDTRVMQERRAGLIDRLLNDANKPGEKTKAEETPVKDVAPA